MDGFSIGEIAQRAGVNSSTLRYYESIGLLPPARRVSGQRRYEESTVQLLHVIHLAQSAGFSISEIQTLVNGFEPDTPPAERWHQLATAKLAELEAQAQRLEQMKVILHTALDCGCLRLEDCASSGKVCGS